SCARTHRRLPKKATRAAVCRSPRLLCDEANENPARGWSAGGVREPWSARGRERMGLRLALGETVANIECRALSVFAQPYALKAVIAGLDPAIHHSRGAQTSLRRAGARVVACSPPPAPSLLPPYKVGGGPLNRVTLAYSRRQLVVNAAIA